MKRYFSTLAVLFCLYLSINNLFAQLNDDDKIIVIGSASVEVPADKVAVRIFLSFQDKNDGKISYEHHKEAEKRLVQFIRDFNIPDSTVSYSLLNISANSNYTQRESLGKLFQTFQTITVTLTDISRYPSFQLGLISLGFTNFNENFESSKALDGEKEAIQRAVQKTRLKAELMAAALGRKIKKVSKISDTEDTEPSISSYYGKLIKQDKTSSVPQLVSIPRTVTIDKQVKVVFDLDD